MAIDPMHERDFRNLWLGQALSTGGQRDRHRRVPCQVGRPAMSSLAPRLVQDEQIAAHLLGRLQGVEFAQVASAPSLGDVEAGVLASVTSLRFLVVSGGVLCIVACIATALPLPKFLAYDSRESSA